MNARIETLPSQFEQLSDEERKRKVAESIDAAEPFGNLYPVTWTPANGLRTLPGSLNGRAWGINDRRQIVGPYSR